MFFFSRLHRWFLLAVIIVLVAFDVGPFTWHTASASASKRVTIGMPFTGRWAYNKLVKPPYTDENSSHPSVHEAYGFDWATDLYAAQNTDVKVLGASDQGTVTFQRIGTSDTCAEYGKSIGGWGITFSVLVDGSKIGEVKYDHLDLDDVGDKPIASGTKIGKITSEALHATCYQARHAHIQLRNTEGNYACFTDRGNPGGVEISQGLAIGTVGSDSKVPKQSCDIVQAEKPEPYTLARPTAVLFNGALNVFAKGNDGQIYTQYWNGTGWTGFSSIGVGMASDPAVIVGGSALNVFVRARDGQIYAKYNDGSGWSGWASLGATVMKGNPKVVQYAGELDVFALGADGRPYKNTWQPIPGWGGWSVLSNYMDSSPAAVAYGNELDVIMRGTNNSIYRNAWNGSAWGGFGDLGCCLVGNPDTVSYGGQVDVWGNAPSGHIWKRTWNGYSWGAWTEMGGVYAGDPEVTEYNGDLNVFVRGTDGHIYTRYWSSGGQYWSGWASIGGDIAGEPTAIQYGSELDVFATGTDGKIYKNTFQPASGWGIFKPLPG
jgi:hypothetical protein